MAGGGCSDASEWAQMGLWSAFDGHDVDSRRFFRLYCLERAAMHGPVRCNGKLVVLRFYGRTSFMKGFVRATGNHQGVRSPQKKYSDE